MHSFRLSREGTPAVERCPRRYRWPQLEEITITRHGDYGLYDWSPPEREQLPLSKKHHWPMRTCSTISVSTRRTCDAGKSTVKVEWNRLDP